MTLSRPDSNGMRKSDLFFNVLRLPVDLAMLLSAGLVSYFFRTEILSSFRPVLFEFNLPLLKYFYLIFLVSLVFIGVYAISGLYSMKSRLRIAEEFFKIVIASSAGIMLVIIYIFLRQELFDSRFLVLGSWLFVIAFVFIGRLIIRRVQSLAVSRYNLGVQKLIIVGDNDTAYKIAHEIKKDPSLGYRIVKQFSQPVAGEILSAAVSLGADEIILTSDNYNPVIVSELIDGCHERHIVFKFVPAIPHLFSSGLDIDIFKSFPLVEIKRTNLDGWGRVIKRIIDILSAIIGLIICSPVFLVVSAAVKIGSEGPVFVKLKRVSGTKEFYLYKFRSMILNAEELKHTLTALNERNDGPLFKMRDDPRITKVGRIIRKFRIDELPQFANIFKGEISLVGPRPHQPDEIALYRKHHRRVLAIKAGATGLAQVSGSSDLNFEEEVALDSFYIDNWSLWLDIKIVFRTVLKMFFDRSAV